MAKNFNELRAKRSPEARQRSRMKAKALMADMLISEIRKDAGFTQQDLADALGMKQPSVARIEKQEDMQISTLTRIVECLGGKLEIIAHMPKADLTIRNFTH